MRYITSLNSQWFQKYQLSKLNNNRKKPPLYKTDFFSIVQLWRLVFLEPLGVQRRYVPHFKGLISAKVELEAQGRDSAFTFFHTSSYFRQTHIALSTPGKSGRQGRLARSARPVKPAKARQQSEEICNNCSIFMSIYCQFHNLYK